jgi:NAD(P)-dependent dehydrogenase (short-subunit alcohol dehydrogenase family)
MSTRACRFERNVVIVTGAGRGIGRAIALAFAGEGARVYGLDLDSAGLKEVKAAATSGRGQFAGSRADVSDPASVSNAVANVLRDAGRIDVLVNNAGINVEGRIADLTIADWDRVFDTNLRSVYTTCKAVWATLQAQRSGAVVNMASVMGQHGGVTGPAYCSSKAGIIMLSRCLAKDGAAYGIRVNCVCPGYIDTPGMDAVFRAMPRPPNARKDLATSLPLGRLGSPEDVAAGVLFLASEDAAYISGTELTIDGALSATQFD